MSHGVHRGKLKPGKIDNREVFINSLIKDGFVKIRGFGTFRLRYKKTRSGRNPKTKVEAKIKERKIITFKPSKILKEKINKL